MNENPEQTEETPEPSQLTPFPETTEEAPIEPPPIFENLPYLMQADILRMEARNSINIGTQHLNIFSEMIQKTVITNPNAPALHQALAQMHFTRAGVLAQLVTGLAAHANAVGGEQIGQDYRDKLNFQTEEIKIPAPNPAPIDFQFSKKNPPRNGPRAV